MIEIIVSENITKVANEMYVLNAANAVNMVRLINHGTHKNGSSWKPKSIN